MNRTTRNPRLSPVAAACAGMVLILAQASWGAAQAATPAADTQMQAASSATSDAAARLNKKQFRDVKVSVDQGVATLTGTVNLYQYKVDADNRVRKVNGVTAVRDLIEVAGPTVPDRQLWSKLAEKLAYDRVGYGNVFDAITISVQNGIVTLGGHALLDVDKDSALALVGNYPGVKGIVDEIQVDPVSTTDFRIRRAEFRAIYGYPSLNKYAIDPAKPIRISVQNGHVELYGTVDSESDRNIAFLRANGVPGVFSVKNYLQVSGPAQK